MPENNHSKAETAPPHAQLIQMATAYCVSDIVYVAAKLSLADHLAKGPKSADELAGQTGTHAPSLYRLMRTLANLGILTEDVTHRFALAPLGHALKTGAPGSARAAILTIASDWHTRGFRHLLYSVDTGKSGFEKSLGMPFFDWLSNNPEGASLASLCRASCQGAEYRRAGITISIISTGPPGFIARGQFPRIARQFLPFTPNHVASCSTSRMSFATLPR